jgi:hypothetical protein
VEIKRPVILKTAQYNYNKSLKMVEASLPQEIDIKPEEKKEPSKN